MSACLLVPNACPPWRVALGNVFVSEAKLRHCGRIPPKTKAASRTGMPLENERWLGDLEREVQTAANHSEVVMRAVDNVPAEIAHDSNMTGESVFDAAAELAHDTALVVVA